MQALKTLVVALGALIVVSIGLLAWGFYTKLHQPEAGAAAPAADSRPAPPMAGGATAEATRDATGGAAGVPATGEVHVPLPAGCTAVEMRPDGGRLFVRTGPTGLCERILVIDVATGRLLGDIVLAP